MVKPILNYYKIIIIIRQEQLLMLALLYKSYLFYLKLVYIIGYNIHQRKFVYFISGELLFRFLILKFQKYRTCKTPT